MNYIHGQDSLELLESKGYLFDCYTRTKAIEHNNLELFKLSSFNIAKRRFECEKTCSCKVAECGNVDMMEFLIRHGSKIDSRASSTAAKLGNFEMVKLLEATPDVHHCTDIDMSCIEHNNMDMLKYILTSPDSNIKITPDASYYAASVGNMEAVRLIATTRPDMFLHTVFNCLMEDEHFDTFKYLINDLGFNIGCETSIEAASMNKLHIIKYIYEHPKLYMHPDTAAAAESEEVRDYLVERGFYYNPLERDCITEKLLTDYSRFINCELILNAIRSGSDLKTIKYIISNLCTEISPSTSLVAAKYNRMDIIEYIVQNELCFHPDTSLIATRTKNFDLIKYIDLNNLPFHDDTSIEAVKIGSTKIVKYIYNSPKLFFHPSSSVYAAKRREETMLKFFS